VEELDIIDKVLSQLISAAIIAFGDWVVVGTIAKDLPFVWKLVALFPLLTMTVLIYVNTSKQVGDPGRRRNMAARK
jgi:hypothetical protein